MHENALSKIKIQKCEAVSGMVDTKPTTTNTDSVSSG
jgi:hypothetical protein